MKCLFTLLTVTCFCHIVSSQGDGDSYAGLGYLKPVIEERIRQCGQMWMDRCVSNETSIPSGLCRCAPYFELSSEQIQTVHLGKSVTLFCLFYGYPLPAILWTGPQGRLPVGRHKKTNWDTTIILSGITTSDEGNYSCAASNMFGQDNHALQLRVVAAAEFKHTTDGPYNVTATEGESVTFNCNPFAIPEANITWLQNEQPIDTANPPEGFVFSNDNRSLTIRDVCRDCVDRESKTDLMVIQCNASNDHGYAFAQGYLNVLMRTRVTIKGPENSSVDFLEEKQFVFQCNVTSDPTTPSTVRWYKTEPYEDLVRDEPPYINVMDEFLIITIHPKCSAECFKYLGEYRCVGYNGYSRDNKTITVVNAYKFPSETGSQKEETWASWKIVLSAGAMGLSLLLVGIFLCFRSKLHVRSDDVERRMKVSKVLSHLSVYEEIGCDTSDFPLEDNAGNTDGLKTRKQSMYDRIGYESIDQVLEEIALKEEAVPHELGVHGDIGYESIDDSSERAKGNHRQFLDEKMTRNNMGYSISLGDALKHEESIDRNQVRGQSNEQYESVRTNSDRNREDSPPDKNQEVENSYLDLVSTKANPYLELVSTGVNPHLNLVSTEVNQYLDLVPTEASLTQDLVSTQVNPYTALVSTEMSLTQDLVSTEVNPYMALVPTEANLTQNLVSTEVDPYMALVPTETNLTQDLVSTEVNPYMALVPTEVNQTQDIIYTEANPYLELVSTDGNPYLELVSTDGNRYLELVSTD